MTYTELAHLLEDPCALTLHHLDDLLLLSKQYPYCEPLHRLILLCLHRNGDLRYASELSRRILYISDPAHLYLSLNDQRQKSAELQPTVVDEKPKDAFSIIDDFLEDHPDDAHEVEEILDLIHAPQEEEQTPGEPEESTGDLINAFLEKGASAEIIPTPEEQAVTSPSVTAATGPLQSEELFTETLARIYIRQGKYAQALRIFKTLNLNYSEKNSYFAEQVAYLEKILRAMPPASVDKNK